VRGFAQIVRVPSYGGWPNRHLGCKNAISLIQISCHFLVCSIFILCHEKAAGARYFGRIRIRLGVVHFQVVWLFFWRFIT